MLERTLHRCFTNGARPAEPGEFTFRAYRNGKLDLLEAEGIAALIAARSDAQLAAAHSLHQRQLGQVADGLAATLTDALALVEAGIDFTDQEDVVPIPPERLSKRLLALDDQLATSSATHDPGPRSTPCPASSSPAPLRWQVHPLQRPPQPPPRRHRRQPRHHPRRTRRII